MNNNEQTKTTISCPSCGETIELTAQMRKGAGQANTARMKAEQKIEALRNAGLDVSCFFSMIGADGEDMLVKLKEGRLSVVKDDDPVFAAIYDGPRVPNRDLFRRWVMAQMFHMLVHPKGVKGALLEKGFKYAWEMVAREMEAQKKMARRGDDENCRYRSMWFSFTVVRSMMRDYIAWVESRILEGGGNYARLGKRWVSIADAKSLRERLNRILDKVESGRVCYDDACREFFQTIRKERAYDRRTRIPEAFVEAYVGSGAFFTLRNLIMFHGCRLKTEYRWLDEKESLEELDRLAKSFCSDGRVCNGSAMLTLMIDIMAYNDIDVKAKLAEWRKK